MVRKSLYALLILALSRYASAVDLMIGDVPKVDYSESVVLTTSTTPVGDTLPSGIEAPIFWLDASDTNDWTIAADGKVSEVPSKVGDRKLTTDLTTGHFKGWPNTSTSNPDWYYVRPECPRMITDEAELAKGVSLDFGDRTGTSSTGRRAMAFDAVTVPSDATSPSNLLVNIGTVVMVVKPNVPGSYFPLGGGFGNVSHSGDNWLRNSDGTEAAYADTYLAAGMLRLGNGYAPSNACYAVIRHDGQPTFAREMGWMGSWEVMSFMPKGADLRATGLGIGRETAYGSSYAGGFRVAEMLIFGSLLPKSDVERIEAYLQKKWFGRTPAATGGNAQIGWLHVSKKESTACTVTANVGEGDTLTVDRLQGGRYDGALVKNGAGTLALKSTEGYGGPVTMNGGALAFPARTVPTLADLPSDAYAHFDASDLSTVTYDEETLTVSQWANTTARTLAGMPFGLCQRAASQCPTLRKDALGSGLNVLDFGPMTSGSGPFLSFTSLSDSTVRTVDKLATVVGVIGAHKSGGHLFGFPGSADPSASGWNRSVGWCGPASTLLSPTCVIEANSSEPIYATNDLIVIDGVRAPHDSGYRHPGYQVVAIRMPGAIARHLACSSIGGGHTGGMRVGELFIFRRVLAESEMRDITAYLENKWFGRTSPGYRAPVTNVPRLAKVSVEAASSIDVPAESTVRLGTLTGAGALAKTGSGALAVERLDITGDVSVEGGTLSTVAKNDPGANLCQVAAGASLHLDACDTNRMDISVSGDDLRVDDWYSQSGSGYAWSNSRSPYLRLNAFGPGLNAVDFGDAYGSTSPYLLLDTSRDAVRSVFAVWRMTSLQSPLLGSCQTVAEAAAQCQPYDFIRDTSTGALLAGKTFQSTNVDSVYTNGVLSSYRYKPQELSCHLVELHLKRGFHASSLTTDRSYGSSGGQKLGEIIIYERELTEREKTATRNYLMKKWFSKTDEELTPLPDPEPVVHKVGSLTVAQDATVQLDGTVSIMELKVDGGATAPALSVDGTFAVGEGQVITLTHPELLPSGTSFTVPILSATAFAGAVKANLKTAVINGLPDGRQAKLTVEGNELLLDFRRKGLVIDFR